jgi:ABC-type multidrug transport system ATPase subunit
LLLNGEAVTKEFQRLCCFIPQSDTLYPGLTPRQTFRYQAWLRLPQKMNYDQREEVVEKLLKELQLVKCADTLVGDENTRGLSGGERKRVSIGLELVVNPTVIFCDEPSSGLDSKMAEDVVRLLRDLARTGRLILCTIHQPSWGIFENFDKLFMLHHGRPVYCGAGGQQVVKYFESIQEVPGSFENPLDFFMRTLQEKDTAPTEDHGHFSGKWDGTDKTLYQVAGDLEPTKPLSSATFKLMGQKNSAAHQWKVLAKRIAHDSFRDKAKFAQGLGMKFGNGTIMGIVWFGLGDTTSMASVQSALGPIFFLTLSALMDTMFALILSFPLIKTLIAREYRNGAYDFIPYFCAQASVFVLLEVLSSVMYMPMYFLVGYGNSIDQILIFFLVIVLNTVCGTALGLGLGAIAKDVMEAQGMVMPILLPLLIFNGYMVPLSEIQPYFQWIYHASFLQYSMSTIIINEYKDTNFTDGTGDEYLASRDLSRDDVPLNFIIMGASAFLSFVFAYVFCKRGINKVVSKQ